MQVFLKSIAAFMVIVGAWVTLFPGREAYFALEDWLKERRIFLNEAEVHNLFGGVEINNTTVLFDGIEVGTVRHVRFRTFLFFSSVELEDFRGGETTEGVIPWHTVSRLRFEHTLLRPWSYRVTLDAEGTRYEGEGNMTEGVRLYAVGQPKVDGAERFLRRDSKGWYYEIRF